MSRAVFFLAVFLGFSCTMEPAVKLRVAVTSGYQEPADIIVYAEGEEGQAIDGSLVVVSDPAGVVQVAGFNRVRGGYTAEFGLPVSGTYTVTYSSRLLEQDQTVKIPHQVMNQRATATLVMDANGASAMAGQTLSRVVALSLAWNPVPGAEVYVVHLYHGATLVWTGTSAAPSLLVPARTLTANGACSFTITAQFQEGDPLLRSSSWSSVSSSRSSMIHFNVGP